MGGSKEEEKPEVSFLGLHHRVRDTFVLLVERAQRQHNFNLYVEALEDLVPLFFALDHVNYARWTPIHILL